MFLTLFEAFSEFLYSSLKLIGHPYDCFFEFFMRQIIFVSLEFFSPGVPSSGTCSSVSSSCVTFLICSYELHEWLSHPILKIGLVWNWPLSVLHARYSGQARRFHPTGSASLLPAGLWRRGCIVPARLHVLPASTCTYMATDVFHDTSKTEVVYYLRRFSINHLTSTHPSHISEAYSYNEEAHTAIDFYEACIKHLTADSNKLVITSVFFKFS